MSEDTTDTLPITSEGLEGKGTHLGISIFGLGYVGTVSAGYLATDGHKVIGVDPVQAILNHIPHISGLMVDGIDAVLDHAQSVVIANNYPDFRNVPERLRDDQVSGGFRANHRCQEQQRQV